MPSSSENSSPLSVRAVRIHLSNIRSGMASLTSPMALFTPPQSCAGTSGPRWKWVGKSYSVNTAFRSTLRPTTLSNSVRAALSSPGSFSNSSWLRFLEWEVDLRLEPDLALELDVGQAAVAGLGPSVCGGPAHAYLGAVEHRGLVGRQPARLGVPDGEQRDLGPWATAGS